MSASRLAAWRDRRRDPLTFRLALTNPDTGRRERREYEVPDRPARTWVLAYLSEDPADLLLDVLDPEDADELWDEASDPDSDLSTALLHRIGKSVLARVGGRPSWAIGKLIVQLVSDWDTFIALARDHGLGDPLDWPLEELCAWVYLKITQNKEEAEVARIDAELATPPLDVDPEEIDAETDDDEAGADFMAAMAALGGGMADENGVARA